MITTGRPAPISIIPDLTGSLGHAWRVDLDKAFALAGAARAAHGDVASWLVEAPFAHPVSCIYARCRTRGRYSTWHSYWFHLEGATHELWIYALDPSAQRETMITTGRPAPLLPMNFAAQFIEPSDEAAIGRVTVSVQMVCNGELSPDTDFQQLWIALYGSNMMKKNQT